MTISAEPAKPRIGILHATATGAAVCVFLVVLLWASAAFGMLPHLRALFGPVGAGSPVSFAILGIYALGAGALIGLLVAAFYNAFRFLAAVRQVERG